MSNVLSKAVWLFAAMLMASSVMAQPFGPFDQTADWGPRGEFKTEGNVEFDEESGEFFIQGNGDDIWNEDDEGFFVFTNRSGSWRLSAKVFWEQPGTSEWSKVGVMMREDGADASSRHYWIELRGNEFGDRVDAQWRTETGGASAGTQIFEDEAGEVPVADPGPGLFLRVTRFAEIDLVMSEFSFDGEEWFFAHSMTMEFPDEIAWGLAITSHEDDEFLVDATISDVQLEQVENVVNFTRNIAAERFEPGQSIDVTLEAFNPGADPVDLTLTETIPDGFTAENISNGGTLSDGVITWDLSVPSGNSTLSYTAVVPGDYDPAVYGYGGEWVAEGGETTTFSGDNSLFLITVGVGEELFSFDFEDPAQGDEWTDLAGTWEVIDGQFVEVADAGGPLVSVTGDSDLSDVAISVQAMGLVGDADWGIVYRAADIDNHYSWQFVNGALEMILHDAGARSTIFSTSLAEELNVFQDFQIIVQGNLHHMFFNGEPMAVIEDDTLQSGQVGFFGWVNADSPVDEAGGGIAFDNFVVSTVGEPTSVSQWSLY